MRAVSYLQEFDHELQLFDDAGPVRVAGNGVRKHVGVVEAENRHGDRLTGHVAEVPDGLGVIHALPEATHDEVGH